MREVTDAQTITEDDKAMTDQELRARLDEMTLEHEVNDRLREKQIEELKRFDEMTIQHEVNDRLKGKQFEELKRLADDTRKELSRMPWIIVSLIAVLVVIVGTVQEVLFFILDK